MKAITKLFILSGIVLFCIFSCEKNDEIIVDLNENPFIGTWVCADSISYYSYGFIFTEENFTFFANEGDQSYYYSATYEYTDSTITFYWQDNFDYDPTNILGEYPYELEFNFIEGGLRIGAIFYIEGEFEIPEASPFIGSWIWAGSNDEYCYGFTFTQEEFVFCITEQEYSYIDTGFYSFTANTITFNWQGYLDYDPTNILGEYPYVLDYFFEEDTLRIGDKAYIEDV